MSEKIRIDLENETRKGFDEIVADLERTASSGSTTEQAMGGLNRELASTKAAEAAGQLGGLVEANSAAAGASNANRDAQSRLTSAVSSFATEVSAAASAQEGFTNSLDAGELQAYKDEVERLSAELRSVQNAADDSSDAAERNKNKWKDWQDSCDAMQAGFAMLQSGFQAVSEFSQKMAEDGNSSFQALVDAGQSYQDAMMEIADDETVSGMIRELAGYLGAMKETFVDVGIAAFKGFAMLQDGAMGAMRAMLSLGSSLGILSEDIVECYDEERLATEALRKKRNEAHNEELAQRKEQRAKAEEQAAFEKQQAEAKKEKQLGKLADPGAALRAEEARSAHIAGFQELEGPQGINEEINHVLEYQKQLMDEIAKAGRDPAKDERVLQNAEDLADLERRRMDIIREREKAVQDAQREAEKEQNAANALLGLDRERNREVEKGAKLRQGGRKGDIEARDGAFQGDVKPQNAKRGQKNANDEGLQNPMLADPKMAGAAMQIREKMKRMKPAIRKQIVKNREEQAVSALHARQKKRRVTDPKQIKEEEQFVRTKARNQARNDMARGKFSNEEQEKAVSDLTNGAADMIKKQGGLDKSSVQALEQLTKQANQRAEDSARMQDQLDRINDAIRSLNGRGANGTNRAQRSN